MVLDKLVNSTQLDADLTIIANAIRTKGGTSEQLSFPDGMAQAITDIEIGIIPTGNINITDTNVTDVTNYATAQVVDADLVAANIKKDVNILGVVGSFEGGGGSLPSSITKIDGGSFTLVNRVKANSYNIPHNLGTIPEGFVIWKEDKTSADYTSIISGFVNTHGTPVSCNLCYPSASLTPTCFASVINSSFLSTWVDDTHLKFNASYYYIGNQTYKWIAWA